MVLPERFVWPSKEEKEYQREYTRILDARYAEVDEVEKRQVAERSEVYQRYARQLNALYSKYNIDPETGEIRDEARG